MKFTSSDLRGLNKALNEATVLNAAFDKAKGAFFITIAPVAVDAKGHTVHDICTLRFDGVSRFAASYRQGRWDDDTARVLLLTPEELQENIKSLGTFEIYGSGFIDSTENNFEKSDKRLSFDYRSNDKLSKHTFEFDRDTDNFLACKMWFNALTILTAERQQVELKDFIANGKRAWEAINNNDRKVQDRFGIYPLRGGQSKSAKDESHNE